MVSADVGLFAFALRTINLCINSIEVLLVGLLGRVVHLKGMAFGAVPTNDLLFVGLLWRVVHLKGMALGCGHIIAIRRTCDFFCMTLQTLFLQLAFRHFRHCTALPLS